MKEEIPHAKKTSLSDDLGSDSLETASRRAFIRKSIFGSMVAAQPILFSNLVKADGGNGGSGSGGSTTSPWGTTNQTTYQTTYSTTYVTTAPAPDPKKWKWECRRTVAGPADTAFTQAQLATMEMNHESPISPWWNPPTGPPTGSYKLSGPVVVAHWPIRPNENIMMSRWRDPENPSLQNWQDEDGKWWALYLYDYYEEEFVHDPQPED